MLSSALAVRIAVGAALAVVALAALAAGGFAFTALVVAAALLMSAEWSVMHGVPRGFRLAALVALAFIAAVAGRSVLDAISLLGIAAVLLAVFLGRVDRGRGVWLAIGVLYCGLPMVALLWLRAQPTGMEAVMWLFAIVWATDIAAFFAGRAIGGRRLAPAISPNKTVAGLIGGVVTAAVAAAIVAVVFDARFADGVIPVALAALGGALAVLAQGGDLFESWLKRRAGVKDSGTLLPGHGGVLDRLDGLVPVAVVVAVMVALAPPAGWL